MFSSKKFQKGMEAGARPFEAKFAQHAEALRRLEQNFGKQWKETKEVADMILNHVEEIERARIYGLYPQIDIKELKQEYKEFLIAMLYTLSSVSANEFQQSYIRSVQKYLDIKKPQTSIDFASLENIENINAQKAIFQACVEYFLLGNGKADFFEQYEESLFSHFAVTEKARLEIWENVLQIYTATGPLGLAEKYGFVPEVAKGKTGSRKAVKLADEIINSILNIPFGEGKTFREKKIQLNADIQCAGDLTFEDCVIVYNGLDIKGHITLEKRATLTIVNCTFIGKINKERTEFWWTKSLIKGEDKSSKLIINNSMLYDCYQFSCNTELLLTDCIIQYTDLVLDSSHKLFSCACGSNSIAKNCLFENINHKEASCRYDMFSSALCDGINECLQCSFINISGCIKSVETLTQCQFHNCSMIATNYVLYNRNSLNVLHCSFVNCKNILEYNNDGLNLQFSQFLNCSSAIVKGQGKRCCIQSCQFYHIHGGKIECAFGNEDRTATISKCLFDGITVTDGYCSDFISVKIDKDRGICMKVDDCEFKHCRTETSRYKLINCQSTYSVFIFDKTATAIEVRNCRGLENVNREGELTGDVEIKQETSTGKPIGSRLDDIDVGVPGHNIESLLGE